MSELSPGIDLVCWDFGDTLVDERFMRRPPAGVPQWGSVYDQLMEEHAGWVDAWMLGRVSINDLVDPLAEHLPMTRAEISRHLRAVWSEIEWFPEARTWLERLGGRVRQAVVTVNPWEFEGIAIACGLVPLVDAIVTSAELEMTSKVPMAVRARELLGLAGGLSTTLLIDNRRDNVDEFLAAGGQAVHFERDRFGADAPDILSPLLEGE